MRLGPARTTWLLLCLGTAVPLVLLAPVDAHAAKKAKKKSAKESALSNACDDDDGASCGQLAGLLLEKEDIGERDAKRAVALLERGCDLKDAASCTQLARELDHGIWIKKDPPRSAALAQKGCNLGDSAACVQLGLARLGGNGIEQSFKEAIPLFKHACKEEVADGCLHLALMMMEGKGGPPDLSRAEGILERGCELESGEACRQLGDLNMSGKATPSAGEPSGTPNFKKAARFYGEGCELESAGACSSLGRMRLAGQGMGMDPDKADELFETACGLGDAWACVEGNSAPEDNSVVAAMRQSCEDHKDANACFGAGVALLASDDDKLVEGAAGMLQDACDRGVPRGCFKLALALDKGERLPKDAKRSQDLFARACKGGLKKACNR